MKEKLTVLICMAVALTIAAIAQVATSEVKPEQVAASQPVIDPICEVIVELAARDTAAFDEAMVSVSDGLSDEEFGRYSRLYKSNFIGADYPAKVRNAYQASPITAHAMQGAALVLMEREIAERVKEVQALQAKAVSVKAAFDAYE